MLQVMLWYMIFYIYMLYGILLFASISAFGRTEKAQNSSEMPYKHLPEQIQEVMREWDADGSGMVGVSELSAAANAYRKAFGLDLSS